MSYEVDSREPYRANCACGNGYLRYYKVYESNDWGQNRDYKTNIEVVCNHCQNRYRYIDEYLIPNELSYPTKPTEARWGVNYTEEEEIVNKYSKEEIELIIVDMTAPKHTYIKNLQYPKAVEFAQRWYSRTKKKTLAPMVNFLRGILAEYDNIDKIKEQKRVVREHIECEWKKYEEEKATVQLKSFKVTFEYDEQQAEIDRAKTKKEQEEYIEAHRYDDFTAQVSYDPTFKKDLTGFYWDSYLIKQCVDDEHLSLEKGYGLPKVVIAKKYNCVCQLCGREDILNSKDFKIEYKDDIGYFPVVSCGCHAVSSFEAKAMDILNRLGISYVREKIFKELVGDYGKPLRFDFALYKTCDFKGTPIIDLLIELQGPHHYKSGCYDEYGDFVEDLDNSRLNRQQRYDEKKQKYCQEQGVSLECIRYASANSYGQLEERLIKILKQRGYRYCIPIDVDDESR